MFFVKNACVRSHYNTFVRTSYDDLIDCTEEEKNIHKYVSDSIVDI